MAQPAKYYYGVGRRKRSTVTVRLYEGKGESTVNGKSVKDVYQTLADQKKLEKPFILIDKKGDFHYTVRAQGGGKSGQRDAIVLGIARALAQADESYRPVLKKEGLFTRDSRKVERKKVNRRKARKGPQFSKR